MTENLEKELEDTKKKVQDLTLVLKQVLNLVNASVRVDQEHLLEDIKNIIKAELK